MVWGWLVVGLLTFFIVGSLGEICSAYPVRWIASSTTILTANNTTTVRAASVPPFVSPTSPSAARLSSDPVAVLDGATDYGCALLLGVPSGGSQVGALRVLDGRLDQPPRTGQS